MLQEQLYKDLGYGNPKQRAEAARQLGQLTTAEALPILIKALTDEEAMVRAAAAAALARYGVAAESATPGLIERLRDGAMPVRKEAAAALGAIGDAAALKPLTKLIEENRTPASDAQHGAVMEALKALGYMRSIEAVPVLIRVMMKGYRQAFTDWVLQARQAAAYGLSLLDNPEGNKVMVACLFKEERRELRESLSEALGRLRSDHSFKLIVEALPKRLFEDQELAWMRQETLIKALGLRGSRQALPYLMPYVASPQTEVRLALIEAVIEIGSVEQPEVMIAMLRDALPQVRTATARALGKLKVASALNALEVAERDSDRRVADAAREALAAIKPPEMAYS